MQATACKHTTTLMQRLNDQALEPGDAEHLSSCPDCREAMAIRNAMLDQLPESLPDRSALLWQQHTIHQLLKREKKQSGLTLQLFVIIDIVVLAILAAALIVIIQKEPVQSPIPGIDRPFENLLLQPFVWGTLLITGVIVYIALRWRKSKN